MQIQDEIFEEFFNNIRETGVPASLVDELKTLWEEGQNITKEKLLDHIQKYSKHDCQD